MTDATKKQAFDKLNAIANKIGYPDKWRDYSAVQITRDDFLGNLNRAAAFETKRQLDKIGKPLDRAEWGMTPPTVNAYYNPLMNDINFPAGILQPPFFDKKMDDAVNFGGIGAVIGHEITHGFDDQGRQFDADGNLTDWWTEADAKEFEKRADCIVQQYGGLRRGRRREAQRQADPRREHRRQRRPAHRLHGADPGRRRRRQGREDRRLHPGAALLPGLRPDLVREPDARVRPPRGPDRPPLPGAATASTASSPTCRSSRRPSAARRAHRWCAPTPAASGRPGSPPAPSLFSALRVA